VHILQTGLVVQLAWKSARCHVRSVWLDCERRSAAAQFGDALSFYVLKGLMAEVGDAAALAAHIGADPAVRELWFPSEKRASRAKHTQCVL
jgi:hypothetical protein